MICTGIDTTVLWKVVGRIDHRYRKGQKELATGNGILKWKTETEMEHKMKIRQKCYLESNHLD